MAKSLVLMVILSYGCEKQNIRRQTISKRVYKSWAHALIPMIHLFRRKGLSLRGNQGCLKVFDAKKLQWGSLHLKEPGQTMQRSKAYFKGNLATRTNSKLLQINDTVVYVVGGSQDRPSLLPYRYNVPRSCLRIDMKKQEVEVGPDLVRGRREGHAVCVVGQRILVVGG